MFLRILLNILHRGSSTNSSRNNWNDFSYIFHDFYPSKFRDFNDKEEEN